MILNIKTVEFRNFLSFGNKWQSFDFTDGLNLILGKVAGTTQANAAGKSNLIDAVIFGLYGKVTKNITKDQIPNWKNKKNCEVKITFEKGPDTFIIHRGIFPTILKLYKNGVEENQLSHNREFQDEIETLILGIDYETFISIAHYNATQSQSIFNVSKGAKRAFLEKLFGLEIYTEILIKCNNKISQLTNKLTTIQNEIGFNNKRIIEISAQNTRFKTDIQSINIDALENELLKLEKEKKEHLKEKNIAETRILELKEKENKIQEKITALTTNCIDISKKIHILEGKVASIIIINCVFDEIEYNKIYNEKMQLDNKLQNTESLDTWNITKDQYTNAKEQIIKDINILNIEIARLKGKLESIPTYSKDDESGVCPLCNSNVSLDHINKNTEEKKEKYTAEIKSKEAEKRIKNEELCGIKNRINDINENIDNIDILVKRQSVLNDLLYKAQAAKLETELNKEKLEEKIKITKQIEKLQDKLKTEQENNEKYNKMIKMIDTQIDDLQKTSISLNNAEIEISKLKGSIEIKEAEINRIKDFIKENKSNLDVVNRANVDLNVQEKKYKNMLDYLEYVRKITKDDGARTYAIQNTIPFLTKKANEYLSNAGCTFYLKLDSMLNAEIKGPGIINATFGSLSSGQQKVTNVAMLLAFLDLFKLRSPVHVNILMLDEILDSAIDSTTLTQMMNIIQQKQQKENLKCYIISHRKEISEVAQFDTIYKIEKTDGFSKIHKVA